MKRMKVGSLRLAAAGVIVAGAAALPLAASAQTIEDCANASPSDVSCQNPTTTAAPTTTPGSSAPATTAVVPTTTAAPDPSVAPTVVDREPDAIVLNSTVAADDTDSLAFTGGDAAGLAAMGAGAVALGGVLVLARRRRDQKD